MRCLNVISENGDMATVAIRCVMCKEVHNLDVIKNDLMKYENGEHVQNCFPYLSPAERELIISQTCGKCFDELFKDD